MKTLIKKAETNALLPKVATANSAGADLFSAVDCLIQANEIKLIPTGICLKLPDNSVGFICPRSGLALKHRVTVLNSPGVVDSDYTGEIKVLLINHSVFTYPIIKGDRIAQLVILPIIQFEAQLVDDLIATERGQNGFGSTGS
ncbi:MAG: dUTP diphosphatase [Xenococcaceae cyanobacterium]